MDLRAQRNVRERQFRQQAPVPRIKTTSRNPEQSAHESCWELGLVRFDESEECFVFGAVSEHRSRGVLRTNSPVDQEKAVIANQLLANSVIAQTVVDQTWIIQQLKREGYSFALSEAKHLSPHLTRHLLRFGKFATRCETEPLNLGARSVAEASPGHSAAHGFVRRRSIAAGISCRPASYAPGLRMRISRRKSRSRTCCERPRQLR